MLGQTNTSGGNTSELEIAVANLTSNMYELNGRMNEIELSSKKWYFQITKPSATNGFVTQDTYSGPDPLITVLNYNLLKESASIASLNYTKSGSYYSANILPTSNTTLQIDNGTPMTLHVDGSMYYSSAYPCIIKLNIYVYGELKYTYTAQSGISSYSVNKDIQFMVTTDTRFRSEMTGSEKYTVNIYIEEYTP